MRKEQNNSSETEMSIRRRSGGLGPFLLNYREENGLTPAVLPPGRELKSLDPGIKASRFGSDAAR